MKRHVHRGRRICLWCVMQSLAFPIEHVIWERMPGLSFITTHVLGV